MGNRSNRLMDVNIINRSDGATVTELLARARHDPEAWTKAWLCVYRMKTFSCPGPVRVGVTQVGRTQVGRTQVGRTQPATPNLYHFCSYKSIEIGKPSMQTWSAGADRCFSGWPHGGHKPSWYSRRRSEGA